jgi:hypothetical protein
VFVRSQDRTSNGEFTFVKVGTLQLKNNAGNRITIEMDHEYLVSQNSEQAGFPSPCNKETGHAFYHIPFALNMAQAYNGHATGGYNLQDGNTVLHLTASSDMAGTNSGSIELVVSSLNYAYCRIANGIITFER